MGWKRLVAWDGQAQEREGSGRHAGYASHKPRPRNWVPRTHVRTGCSHAS